MDCDALVTRALQGCEDSFAALARYYHPRLIRLITPRLAQARYVDAEDVAQEALTRAFEAFINLTDSIASPLGSTRLPCTWPGITIAVYTVAPPTTHRYVSNKLLRPSGIGMQWPNKNKYKEYGLRLNASSTRRATPYCGYDLAKIYPWLRSLSSFGKRKSVSVLPCIELDVNSFVIFPRMG